MHRVETNCSFQNHPQLISHYMVLPQTFPYYNMHRLEICSIWQSTQCHSLSEFFCIWQSSEFILVLHFVVFGSYLYLAEFRIPHIISQVATMLTDAYFLAGQTPLFCPNTNKTPCCILLHLAWFCVATVLHSVVFGRVCRGTLMGV